MTRLPALRICAVLLAGFVGVHELRYVLAFGSESGAVQAHTGHGYLAAVGPSLGLVTALALAQLVVRAGRGATSRRVVWRRAWPVAAGALLALYGTQEALEGALSPAHPGGLDGVFGSGGWLAVPLSVAFGALAVLALRVAGVIEGCTSRLRASVCIAPAPVRVFVAWLRALRVALLAEHRAGRGPPLLCA